MIVIRQLSERVQDTGKDFNNAAICTFKNFFNKGKGSLL